MSARQAAGAVLELCEAPAFRASIRYATQDVFVDLSCDFITSGAPQVRLTADQVSISVACLLFLKLSRLFPEGIDLTLVLKQASQLQMFLRDFPEAHRFSLTIKWAPAIEAFATDHALIYFL
jgi:hypothetical protein